jgi:hypothetical protein
VFWAKVTKLAKKMTCSGHQNTSGGWGLGEVGTRRTSSSTSTTLPVPVKVEPTRTTVTVTVLVAGPGESRSSEVESELETRRKTNNDFAPPPLFIFITQARAHSSS